MAVGSVQISEPLPALRLSHLRFTVKNERASSDNARHKAATMHNVMNEIMTQLLRQRQAHVDPPSTRVLTEAHWLNSVSDVLMPESSEHDVMLSTMSI